MLQSLYIENVAVIEKTSVELDAGLNILTGETGAGKSILIDSICAVLGERTSRDIVRSGTEKASVTAVFTDISDEAVEALNSAGYSTDEYGSLLINRVIKSDGKGTCRINGCPVTVSVLKGIGRHLINIHGQHDNQMLLSPERHIKYIDKAAGNDELLRKFTEQYERLKELEKKLRDSNIDTALKEQKIDLLSYQIKELEEAEIEIGELDELQSKRNAYMNSEKVIDGLNEAYGALTGGDDEQGARDLLSASVNALDSVASYFQGIDELVSKLRVMVYEIDDYTEEIRNMYSELEYDPEELDYIEERLDLLHRLSRKYGPTEQDMLTFLENARRELSEIELSDEMRDRLEKERLKVHDETMKLAAKLSESRQKSVKRFVKKVTDELTFLDMPKVKMAVSQQRCELCPNGIDKIEFLISVNPGEDPKPISKIASGGELSRIMLAIKDVLAENDDIDTLIFDEIDTGVSGSAAQKIGLKLKEVSKNRQVICITHLAQIAAYADSHLLIEKSTEGERTYTSVKPLDFESRTREVARIMGGIEITELTLKSAEEMIRRSSEMAK